MYSGVYTFVCVCVCVRARAHAQTTSVYTYTKAHTPTNLAKFRFIAAVLLPTLVPEFYLDVCVQRVRPCVLADDGWQGVAVGQDYVPIPKHTYGHTYKHTCMHTYMHT